MTFTLRPLTFAALCLTLVSECSAQNLPTDFVDENMITHGPILGRLSSDGVGVWARTLRTGEFSVLYGTDPERLDRTAGPVTTSLEHDNTGVVYITGLEPDTKYFYVLKIPESTGQTGRGGDFKTLPDSKRMVDAELNPEGLFNFSFEFACGNNQNPRHSLGPALPTFGTMLREIRDEVDFAILNGDWLYEVRREYRPDQWAGQVNIDPDNVPDILKIAPTITGVWENYKFFLDQGENLSHWHRVVPSFFTYDDHECLNDIWGAGTAGLRDRRAVFRDIGVQAWYDYLAWSNPTEFNDAIHFGQGTFQAGSDVLVDDRSDFTAIDWDDHNNLHVHWGTPTAGVNDNALDERTDEGDPNAGVYDVVEVLGPHRLRISPAADADGQASYSIGRRSWYHMRISNCDFFVLDTRGQREMHDTRHPDKDISMLGLAQRKWLLDGVRNSDADFIFVVSSVNFMVPHVGGGAVRTSNKDDAWTVFLHEREMLIDVFDGLETPVFVLTGDLHNSFAIQITDNVYEMASGPHNSNNHWVTDEGDRPANGRFQYGPRPCDILWSTYFRSDIGRTQLMHPTYCVVQVNNVFNNPLVTGQPDRPDETRWVAFPRPQVIFRYYNGRTGALRFAHSVRAAE